MSLKNKLCFTLLAFVLAIDSCLFILDLNRSYLNWLPIGAEFQIILLSLLIWIVFCEFFSQKIFTRITSIELQLQNLSYIKSIQQDDANDEISHLQKSINKLIQRLVDQSDEITAQSKIVLEALRDAQEAKESMSKFLSNANHELRNPLTNVLCILDIILKWKIEADLRQKLVIVYDQAKMMHTITNDLLDLSKMDSGQMQLEKIPFSIFELVDEQLQYFHDQTHAKGLKFVRNIDSKIPRWLLGDSYRLRQVLQNLLHNALKFTQRGSISLNIQLISQKSNSVRLHFSVQDTGIGISTENQQKIFQKFKQATSQITRKFGGTGLGLSICKELITLMGSGICVQSELKQGSTFSFDIEFNIVHNLYENSVSPSKHHTHRLKILVVDDSPHIQWILAQYLGEMGHDTVTANDGLEALMKLSTHKYDLVFLDGRMPIMNGEVTASHLRKGSYEQYIILDPEIYIVGISANNHPEDIAIYLQAGMTEVTSKPIDPSKLFKIVENVIEYQHTRGLRLNPQLDETPTLSPMELAKYLKLPLEHDIDNEEQTTQMEYSIQQIDQFVKEHSRVFFMTETPNSLNRMKIALRQDGFDEVGMLAHKLKALAMGIDEPHLVEICQKIENAAKKNDPNTNQVVQELEAKFTEFI